MTWNRRTAIIAVAALLGVVAIALTRGEGPSTQLQALQADRMATYVPPGGELVDTEAKNEGTSLGKPVLARYARLFALPPGTERAVLEDARATALAAGWKQASGDDERPFIAGRSLPAGRAELGITLLDARLVPEGVKPPVLLVSLRQLGR